MKLITLNIWGGKIHEPFMAFLKAYKEEVDIFCFQEIFKDAPYQHAQLNEKLNLNIFKDIEEILEEHNSLFKPVIGNHYGIAIFVKKNIEILDEGEIFIHENEKYDGHGGNHPRNLQWITFMNDKNKIAVINLHGLWNGQGKTDTDDRINQSKKIRGIMDKLNMPKIVCGDFNLLPNTESLKIIESGMKNLIKEHNIISTRSSLYSKPDKFADYMFVSPEIQVKTFKVLPDEVSDHNALMLDF